MRIKGTTAAFVAATAFCCSCHDDVYIINNGSGGTGGELTDVTLTLSPLSGSDGFSEESDPSTRTLTYETVYLSEEKKIEINPHWDTSNSVGVFPIKPETNAQVKYTFDAGRVSELHTTYKGQGWNLKPDNEYASYYPFQDFVNTQSAKNIPMSFHDQRQSTNNNFDHLDGINYIYYATSHLPEGENTITFTYKNAAGLMWIRIIAPDQFDYRHGRLTIASYNGEKIFTDSATVNVATGEITRLTTTDRTVLHFDNLWTRYTQHPADAMNIKETLKGDTINLYLSMAPIGKTSAKSKVGILAFELRSGSKTYYAYSNSSTLPIANTFKWYIIEPTTAMRPAVDMGLPSGTQWATCNLGALTPTDPGYYFAWGELEPMPMYFWTVYRFNKPNEEKDVFYTTGALLRKYTIDDRQYYGCWYDEDRHFKGDNLRVLEPEDDAAVYMQGSDDNYGSWDMPTREQFQELLDHTTLTWIENYRESGVNGYLCTMKKEPHNSIFFPAAGYMGMENETDFDGIRDLKYDEDGVFVQEGARGFNSDGYYWTRSLSDYYSTDAYEFKFNTYTVNNGTNDPYLAQPTPNITTTKRYVGQSIRPVFHPKK